MISLEEAKTILELAPIRLQTEEVGIESSLFRILAQDIISRVDMPPFDKSAMDGYAYDSQDTSDIFKVVETIPAGIVPRKRIKKGECAKIMTGGMLPEGADRVIKKEATFEEDGLMRITGIDANPNICHKGEDLKIGEIVLSKGAKLRPAEVGIAASSGLSSVKVYQRPAIGILTTGSELVAPGSLLENGQIYDSNSFSLAAQAVQVGAVIKQRSSADDNPKILHKSIHKMLETCDIVLVSGGVSMGDFDYVPGILENLGVHLHFKKVAVRPGMPTVFGMKDEHFVFGIPGNPVSTFVIFEIFIKPFLFRMMGHDYQPEIIQGKLETKFSRRNTERTAFIPVRHREGKVELLPYHGSAHLHSLSQANGLIEVPRGMKEITEGSTVYVRLI